MSRTFFFSSAAEACPRHGIGLGYADISVHFGGWLRQASSSLPLLHTFSIVWWLFSQPGVRSEAFLRLGQGAATVNFIESQNKPELSETSRFLSLNQGIWGPELVDSGHGHVSFTSCSHRYRNPSAGFVSPQGSRVCLCENTQHWSSAWRAHCKPCESLGLINSCSRPSDEPLKMNPCHE